VRQAACEEGQRAVAERALPVLFLPEKLLAAGVLGMAGGIAKALLPAVVEPADRNRPAQ